MTDQLEGGVPLAESQNYNQIGSESPELHGATEPRKGWQGAAPEPQLDQLQGKDFSAWNKRANRQDQAAQGADNHAAAFFDPGPDRWGHWPPTHNEIAAGAEPIPPFKGYAEDGIVDGAK